MKRRLCVSVLSAAMAVFLLAGCGQADDAPSRQPVQGNEDTEPEKVEVQTVDEGSQSMEEDSSSVQEPSAGDGNVPVVYMTTEISPESLIAIYEALGASPSGSIAIKLSTGEPGSNYLRTDLIGDLVMSFEDPTIVECNTAYGGPAQIRQCTIRWRRITGIPPLRMWTLWMKTVP